MDANKSWKTGLFLCLLSTAAVGQGRPDAKLLIVVYDKAHVGSKTMERSERLAGTIVLKAGIQSSWDAGPVEDLGNLGMDFTAYPGRECQAEPISGILRLQILSHAPGGLAAQALGFSLPCARRGVQVTIYADRVADVSETGGPTFGRVLAYAMAHELGHVLLHSDRHEDTGLMKDIWSKSDWQRAAVSVISFSPSEARQIARFLQKTKSSQLAQLASLEKH
jgi:hypothetical protein